MWSPAFASDVNCSACAVWVYGEHPRGYRQHCRTAAHSLWTVTYTGEISRTVSTWLRAGRTQVNSTKQPPHSTTYSKHTKHTRWRSGSGLAGRFLHLPGLLHFRPVPLSPCFPDASIRYEENPAGQRKVKHPPSKLRNSKERGAGVIFDAILTFKFLFERRKAPKWFQTLGSIAQGT